MASFPRIDRPCPLSRAEQAGLGEDCRHCNHRVHRLDGLDDAGRHALLASAGGPLCVSYRLPAGMAALALALAMPAGAQALPDPGEPASIVATSRPEGPQSAAQPGTVVDDDCDDDELALIVVGGISAPDDAQWLDEAPSALPEVPYEDEAPDA